MVAQSGTVRLPRTARDGERPAADVRVVAGAAGRVAAISRLPGGGPDC